MEILAGETSSYNLLSFISYKMELSWASTPVDVFFCKYLKSMLFKQKNTVHPSLPFYQIYTK